MSSFHSLIPDYIKYLGHDVGSNLVELEEIPLSDADRELRLLALGTFSCVLDLSTVSISPPCNIWFASHPMHTVSTPLRDLF